MSALPQDQSAPNAVATHSTPSTASLRLLLQTVFVLDADLDAFCLDFFPAVHAEFTLGMIRTAKVNLLLSIVSPAAIFAELNEHYPDAVAECVKDGLSPVSKGRAYRLPSMLDSRERRNRQRMIEKVRKFWIEGVLEKSLHGAVMMELGKEYRPDAVAYPWEMVLERPDTTPQPIPHAKKMIELFDENLGELLILGAPGSGKTTMLLDLCRDLLERAELDETAPIPVVFNLSSWGQKRQPLVDWMKGALHLHYQIPRQLAAHWIDSTYIIPLLDGLDEVRHEYRVQCIETLNSYLSTLSIPGIAVSCRENEYTVADACLKLTSAIYLQTLASHQITQHLVNFGNCRQDEIEKFTSRAPTKEVLSIPLFLMVLLELLHSKSRYEISEKINISPSEELLNAHVRKALWSIHQQIANSLIYLRWLAKYFQNSDETIFYVEKMQPPLLVSPKEINLYFRINTICHGILFGVATKLWFAADNSWIVCIIIGLIASHYTLKNNYPNQIRLIETWKWSWENLKTRGEAVIHELTVRTRPNQGTMNSLRMAVFMFVSQFLYLSIALPLANKKYGHIRAIEIGLGVGLFLFLGFGGSPVLRHFLLRILLVHQNHQPWRYVAFLESCVKVKILIRVGGGYTFIHRLFMEYFASLSDDDIKRMATEVTSRK